MKMARAVLICGMVPLAALAAGCGSSSSGSSGTQAASASAGSQQPVASCLRKQGVQLPQQRRPGSRPRNGAGSGGGGGFLFGGGGAQGGPPRDPSKIQSALRNCGINPRTRGNFSAGNGRFRQALTNFVTCVRSNGYNLPAPNTSGSGPVFDPSKVNRDDPKFKAAAKKCEGKLRALRPQNVPPPGGPATTG